MKNMRIAICVISVMGCFILQSCASGDANRKLDDKIAAQGEVRDRKQLQKEATDMIESAQGLSADQKSQLLSLRNSTKRNLDDLQQQSLRLKSLLVKDLLTSGYDSNEVGLIKSRLKDVESKKLSTTFDAVERANTILGRQVAQNPDIMDEFMESERARPY